MSKHHVRPFDRDRLMLVKRDGAMKEAMRMLSVIQSGTPEEMMAGVSIMFYAFTRRTGLDAHDAYELGRRLVDPQQFHQKGNILAETIRDFAGIRIKGDTNTVLG